METRRFIRKDWRRNGKLFWYTGIPKDIQEKLGWQDANNGIFEWGIDTENGRLILVRVPVMNPEQIQRAISGEQRSGEF